MAKKPEKLKQAVAKPAKVKDKEVPGEQEDYLQQYQYKKVNDVPTIGGPLTNPDKSSKAERMKEFLLTQEKVSTMIPLDSGTDPKVPYSVNLNGYRLDLPTNTYIELPKQVSEVIRQSNNQTVAALSRDRIGGNKEKENALG